MWIGFISLSVLTWMHPAAQTAAAEVDDLVYIAVEGDVQIDRNGGVPARRGAFDLDAEGGILPVLSARELDLEHVVVEVGENLREVAAFRLRHAA